MRDLPQMSEQPNSASNIALSSMPSVQNQTKEPLLDQNDNDEKNTLNRSPSMSVSYRGPPIHSRKGAPTVQQFIPADGLIELPNCEHIHLHQMDEIYAHLNT